MDLQITVNRESLRYDVQRAITCPRCGSVLDVRRAVSVSNKSGQTILTVCAPCFDERWPSLAHLADRVDILDGRTLFARAARQA